jgi:triosephosphate isomerase (TIM)
MKRLLIAGNWKMNLDRQSAVQLASRVAAGAAAVEHADLAVCPPSVYLSAVGEALAGTSVKLGAQNVYHQPKGAFTGEISTAMLTDVGCHCVILGHSERRHIFHETDAEINRKLLAVLETELWPIVCVGELLEEREAGKSLEVVRGQCAGSLAGLTADQMARVTLAYEPVWAIGTGKVATPEIAQEIHADLRKTLSDRYNSEVAGGVRILYGGSVKPDNASDLLTQPDIDGALVGGASLKADSFLAIAAAAKPA